MLVLREENWPLVKVWQCFSLEVSIRAENIGRGRNLHDAVKLILLR